MLSPVPGQLADVLIGDTLAFLTSPFSSEHYSGTLTTLVVQGEVGNPFPGGLTFRYTVRNDPTSSHSINRLSINGFSGFLIDVGHESQGPVLVGTPAYADREEDGSSIGFEFAFASLPVGIGSLGPGQASHTLVVHTNATLFTGVQSSAFVLNGVPASAVVYAPIPEPSATVLAISGLGLAFYCFACRFRRRK